MAVFEVDALNVLALTQDLDTVEKYPRATNQLQLIQAVTCNIKQVSASNRLNLVQGVANNTVFEREAVDFLSWSVTASPMAHDVSVTQFLGLGQTLSLLYGADQTLIFNQTAEVELVKAVNQTIAFTQSATYTRVTNQNVSQTISFASHATGYIDNVCKILTTLTNPPTAAHQDMVFTCGTSTLTLRPPDFDNVEKQEYLRVMRRTRSGDLTIFRDTSWPKDEAFQFRWSALKQSDVNNILAFTKANLGKLITLVDYENRTFTGLLRAPELEISQPARNLWAGQLEFETQS